MKSALRAGFGIDALDIVEVEGGADPLSKAYRVGQHFVKLVRRPSPTVAVAAALREAGVTEVVAPARARHGSLSWPCADGRLLVFDWLDAANGFDRPLTLAAWEAVGRALRQVHEFSGSFDLPQESFVVQGVERVAAVLAAPPVDAVGGRLRDVLTEHKTAWSRRVGQLSHLSAECLVRDWELVPCHADLHIGNILIDGSGGVHLTDWDTARLAPRECDFLFFCNGGIGDWHGEAEEQAFWSGYGPCPVDATALAYYQVARVVEDVVAYVDDAAGVTSAETKARESAIQWIARLLG